ncbi:MAG: type II secretion system protein [Patescibacteria group bacterium]
MKYEVRSKNLKNGFTLIELLVVIAVLGVVGSIVMGAITFSLRGANKTSTIENIRQNGNYTISQMAKTIEYSQTFDGLSTDGITYVRSCPATQPTPTPTSTDYSYIKIKPFNNNSIVYRCQDVGGGNYRVASDSAELIDTTSASSEISMSACTFTCTVSRALDIPVIRIHFILKPKVSSTLVEKFTPPITFETAVTIRNYQR